MLAEKSKSLDVSLESEAKPKELNIVDQREYLIIKPSAAQPILATYAVLSCYAVCIFQKEKRSAILHWDDNVRRSEIEKFAAAYLGDDLTWSKAITVHIIGGWKDHLESAKSGNFLRDYFKKLDLNLNLTGFQQKEFKSKTKGDQGFFSVSLDARDGKVSMSSDWSKKKPAIDEANYGLDLEFRQISILETDYIHFQDDKFEESGTVIYPRDNFFKLWKKQALDLCRVVSENKKEAVINCFDEGVIGVDASPAQLKGWTALHWACQFGRFEMATLLIYHGANLYKKNKAKNTPLDLFKGSQDDKDKLIKQYKTLQTSINQSKEFLYTTSIFARHPERLNSIEKLAMTSVFKV